MPSDHDKRSGVYYGDLSEQDLDKVFVDGGYEATPLTSTNVARYTSGPNRESKRVQSSASAYTNMNMPIIDEGTALNSSPFEGFLVDAANLKSSAARKTYSLGKGSEYGSGTLDELADALRGQLHLDPTHEVEKYKDGAKKLWLGFTLEKLLNEHND